MSLFSIIALVLTLTALAAYLNHRYLHLPVTIGVMGIALLMSLAVLGLDVIGLPVEDFARHTIGRVDFGAALMEGMLSFLLFAGALQVKLEDVRERQLSIGLLATFGVVLSTFLVGTMTWYLLGALGYQVVYAYCLLFGALISPTDPIAVLGIVKTVGAPRSLEVKIAGESLLNDGVGVVVFLTILGVVTGGSDITPMHVATLFAEEALGGALFGLVIGYVAYRLLKSIDQYQVEALITLALVTGGYALASTLHVSGPIAIVVAGVVIGNYGRALAMSGRTRRSLDLFWELIDEILNAVLFLLIGLEVLVLEFTGPYLMIGVVMIPLVLFSRFVSVALPIAVLSRFQTFTRGAVRILTWGGLRGGISVALALSLPAGPERDIFVAATYMVVVFSILVQGLTMPRLVRRLVPRSEAQEETAG